MDSMHGVSTGHQKKMMLAVDRMKRLNRVRSTASNGTPGTLRRASTTSSDCIAPPPSHVSIHRTHSAVVDCRRNPAIGIQLYPPSATDAPSRLVAPSAASNVTDRYISMSTRCDGQSRPYCLAFNNFDDESHGVANLSAHRGPVIQQLSRSRQTTSSAPSSGTFSNSFDVCATLTTAATMTTMATMTNVATMPDIIGRTLSTENGETRRLYHRRRHGRVICCVEYRQQMRYRSEVDRQPRYFHRQICSRV